MPAGSSGKFKKRVLTLTRTATGDVVGSIGVGGQKYFKCSQFTVTASATTTTAQLTFKDRAASRTFYADAADRSLTAATPVHQIIASVQDANADFTTLDAAGAALTATESVNDSPILEGPIQVTWNDTVVASGTLRLEFLCEV